MKIIIAGAGRIGALIARSLDREGHDITLIDRDAQTIERCSGELDVICVLGSATNPDTLRESGAEDADVLLALTESDEMNMLCALAAKRLGRPRSSARAAGGAVGRNPVSLIVPCHRVVGSGGALTGYAGGTDRKRRLLELEQAKKIM